jgi:hypothetical protein
MSKNINIIYNKSDENFGTFLAKSLEQLVEKNDDISLKIEHNSSPTEYNIFINNINDKLVDTKNTNIIINTVANDSENLHHFAEVDFYFKNLTKETQPLTNNKNKDFWLKVYDLLTELNIIIDHNKYVYIAPCSLDQNLNRDILKRQFIKEDYEVLPHNNKKQTEKKALLDIAKSEFSIHILDEDFGKQNSICEYYNNIAAKHINSKYKTSDIGNQLRFIWISPELSFYDENQQLKLQKFRLDVEGLKGAEILQTPIELLKNLLKNRIKLGINTVTTSELTKKQVYLIHEENDDLTTVHNMLESTQVFVINTSFGANRISEHRKQLVNATDVVILGDYKNINWINSKVKDILKAPGFGKKTPFNSATLLVSNTSEYQKFENYLDIISSDEKSIKQFIKTFQN